MIKRRLHLLSSTTAAIALLAGLSIPVSAQVPPIPGNWTLTFSDEFNSANTYLDGTKWRVGQHWAGTNGVGSLDPALSTLDGDKLALRTQQRSTLFSGVTRSYASSEITTFKTFRQQYGYFEARIKFPGVTGLWPAFWLMPDRGNYGWADGYRQSYIKFDLSAAGITAVSTAQLKLTTSGTDSGADDNVLIMKLRNDSWTESTLTWNNKPVADPAWIKQYWNQTYAANQQITTDVTAFVAEQIAGDKKVSFVLADTFMRARLVRFHSSEAATQSYRPQLVINGVTYYASEDTHARAGSLANTNYGSATVLEVQDSYDDASNTFNGGMETDIMESLGKYGAHHTYHTVHWDGYGSSHQTASSGKLTLPATGDGYHTYGLYWQAGVMEFYVDGVYKWSWNNSRVCSVPCYVLLSHQLGGWDANNPGSQVNNQTMEVDYIRVWSGTKGAVAVPAAPTNLAATWATMLSGWYKLTWTDNSTNETGFTIQSNNGTSWSNLVTLGANVTTYTRTGLSMPSGPYTLRVIANGTFGLSSPSNQVTFSIPAPPPGPTGLTATAGDNKVVLSWSAVSGASSYNISRSTSSTTGFSTIKYNNAGTSYTDTTAAEGTTYYYRVSWVGSGSSLPSSTVSATPF